MMRRLRYHSAAQRDFTNIAIRSEREWGKPRTRRYLDDLESKIGSLIENPTLGHGAELPRAGLHRISSGRDVIFYTFDDHEVQIVRILHDRMDFDARLR